MSQHLDDIDVVILEQLQKDGRIQRNKISEMVNLSVPSVSERMKKLEERGLIVEYNAILDAKRFNYDITAFIFVEVDGSDNYQKFINKASTLDEILECHSITGDGSHLLKIRTHNTTSLEKLLSRIQSWEGVKKSRTNIVLSTFKETRSLKVEPGVTF